MFLICDMEQKQQVGAHYSGHLRVLVGPLDAVEDLSVLGVIAVHLRILEEDRDHLHFARGCKNSGIEETLLLLTFTLYFFRAMPTLKARCPTMIILANPVSTTYPYSFESTTILTNLTEKTGHSL